MSPDKKADAGQTGKTRNGKAKKAELRLANFIVRKVNIPMVHERIRELIEAMGTNVAAFSREIGINNHQTMYKLLNNGTKPSYDTLVGILTAYKQVDPRWLLLGEGEMFDGGVNELKKQIDTLQRMLADKERIIGLQESQVANLKERMADTLP